jgi:hypothetical protein
MRIICCALLVGLTGCSGSHVSDAGMDGSDGSVSTDAAIARDGATGSACMPMNVPFNGFRASEAYLETTRPDCEGNVCAVYHLQGDPRATCAEPDCADPAEAARRMFCSCRCAAPDGIPGPFCACPSGMTCEELLLLGGGDIRGSYCVPSAFVTP